MAYKVVMTRAAYPGLPRDLDTYRSLGAQFCSVGCRTEEDIIAAARDADVIITAMQLITRRVIEKLERCRLICLIGIGYEGVDLQAATEHGILVANVPDYCQEEVSDHTMALLLACARKLLPVVDAVRAGKWDSMEKLEIRTRVWPPMFRLRGQTLGIVGLGRIGRAVVPKAQGFGLRVAAYSHSPMREVAQRLGVEMVSLERLLAESDYVSLHCNLTRENRHLIGREQLRRMKPTAYLINTARGGLVDEEALCGALTQGLIAGAALDVTDPEPPRPGNPLFSFPNVILCAHSAHYSEQSAADLRRSIEENVFQVLRGEWPRGLLNPEAKEKYGAKWEKAGQDDATSAQCPE